MLNPTKMLVLTPLNAQNEENVLELDPNLVVGWMGFPGSSMVYINGPEHHSAFSVKETVAEIKRQLSQFL